MENEHTFMMLYRLTPNFEHRPTEEEQTKMQQQWGKFIGTIALKEKLVSTYRLGFEGKQISSDSSVTDGINVLESQVVSGNMVVKAHSLEEATEIAQDCPILLMGGTVEIRKVMPM